MQSSPPQRAWDPPSPATSKYSIDLAALESNSRSGALTPLPVPHVDKILSEDIDGPSDFTQNLEAWMRGGTWKKGSVKNDMDGREAVGAGARVDNLSAPHELDDITEGQKTASHHTPSNSPPKESVFDASSRREDGGETAEEQISSEWDPYAEAQTPRVDGGKAFLQPTVEDYYSELTPARPTSTQAPKLSLPAEDDESPLKSEKLQPMGRPSSPTLSPERSAIFENRTRSTTNNAGHLEQQLQDLTARCQQLEQLNATLTERLDEERRVRSEDKSTHAAQMAEAARREKDLTEMKDQSHAHRESFRREFGELKERLRQYESQQAAHQQELNRIKQDHDAKVQALRSQLDKQRSEHEHDMQALEHEIELERRSKEDFEESARGNRQEIDEKNAELEKMKEELQQGEELREQIKEQLRVAKMDCEKLRGAQPRGEDAAQGDAVADLQRELSDVKQHLQDEQDAHEQLRSLQISDEVSEELDSLRAKLNEATIERDDLQDRLNAEAAEKQGAQERVAVLEAVNTALDDKISGAIRKREEHWRGRMAAAENERRIMARAMLRLWGRTEVGEEDEAGWQEYKYLYSLEEAKART